MQPQSPPSPGLHPVETDPPGQRSPSTQGLSNASEAPSRSTLVTLAAFAEEVLPIVEEAQQIPLDAPAPAPLRKLVTDNFANSTRAHNSETLPQPQLQNEGGETTRQGLLLRAARNSVSLENYDEAIERFQTLFSESMVRDEIHLEYVGVLVQADRPNDAIATLRELISTRQHDPRFQGLLVEVLVGENRHSEAEKTLRTIVDSGRATPKQLLLYARVLAWQGREDQAQQWFEKNVRGPELFGDELKPELAELYLDLGLPQQASNLFMQLAESLPDNAKALEGMIRTSALLGRESEIYETLDLLLQDSSFDQGQQLQLADRLTNMGVVRPALQIYQHIAAADPTDWKIQLKIAAAHRELLEFAAARATLSSLPNQDERLVRHEMAIFKTAVGEQAESYAIYRSLLADQPDDARVLKGLGDLMLSLGDFHAAEQLLRRSQQLDSSDPETPTLLVHALLKQQRIAEALQLAAPNGIHNPTSVAASASVSTAEFASVLIEAGHFEEAESLCGEAIRKTKSPNRLARLRLYQGLAQMRLERYSEAIQTLALARGLPSIELAKLRYGQYRCLMQLGQTEAAQASLTADMQVHGNANSERIATAQLALQDCDCDLAIKLLEHRHRLAPDDAFGSILLGEARSMCDRRSGGCDDVDYYRRALSMSPNNTRALIGLARSYARQNKFDFSTQYYRKILRAFPQHEPARVEHARVVYAWQGVDEGIRQFHIAERRQNTSDSQLFASPPADDLNIFDSSWEYASYRKEMLAAERSGKYWKTWRPHTAIGFYQTLNQMEPSNQEAYFDHAQILSITGETQAAIHKYNELLRIEPCHVEAQIARARMALELRPKLISSFDFEYTAGRGGLADISSLRLETLSVTPRGDEDEYFLAGYAHRVERPAEGAGTNGHVGILGFQVKPAYQFRFYTLLEFENYTTGFSARPTFRSGIDWLTPMDLRLGLVGYLENVVENGESIRQDIFRGGFELTASFNPDWRWQVDGMYRYAAYSDRNSMHEILLNSEYMIIPGRRQLRAKFDLGMLAFDEQHRLALANGSLFGSTHPYFSPDSFTYTSAGLEHKRWTSRHNFHGSCQRWFSGYAGARVDSDAETYGLLEFRTHIDHAMWLSTDFQFTGVFSQVYENVGVSGMLTIRLP
ncbi:MAG: hypothetical protein Aurels2KO_37020 [Aureliella sp.]